MSKKLEPCPFCHAEAKVGYACGDYFMYCSEGCPSPTCDHPSESTTICSWNDWAKWYKNRRAATEANEPCADCSGITYRQTASGKVIPASHICPSKITPPCYQPDGDGCAYQTYGDGGEPIDKCKECPHCYTDKVRHEANEALTLEELREMVGKPVWVTHKDGSGGKWGIVNINPFGICADVEPGTAYWFEAYVGTLAYRCPPEGDDKP